MGGVQVGRGGEGSSVQSMGRWGKTSVQTSSSRFLKALTEGAVTTEAGGLFQYFTTLTENALLGRVERNGGKNSSDQYDYDL